MIKILTSGLVELGVIKNVLGANRLEEINGANTLDFQAVLDAKLQTLIEGDSIFEIDAAYFDTAFFKKTSNEDGTYMVDVEAEHVSYRLNKPAYNVDFFSEIGTPTYILGKILEGTGFTVGVVEFAAQTTYSLQEAKSRRQVLMEFVATLKGELSFHNFEISILTHRGSTEVKPALKGKNIKIVTKTLDKRNLDAEGNPTVSYTCEPLYLPEANYALGDEVMLMQKEIGVMEALRVVRISANPYDDSQVTFDFANYTNGLEDSLYRIMTQAVAKDALYNGVRIGPEYGFEAIRNDKRARAYFRSDGFVMQSGDGSGEGWVDRVYYDPLAGVYMFDGMLSADMITALEAQFDVTISNTMITNVLSAETGNIAELTVDRIETSDFVQRYLAEDQSPVGYWKGYDQNIEFFEAVIGGVEPLYQTWTNYPDSPFLTSEYPYQFTAYDGSWRYVYCSNKPWYRTYTNRSNTDDAIAKSYYTEKTNSTGWYENFSATGNVSYSLTGITIQEANENVLDDSVPKQIYFAQTTGGGSAEPVQIRNRQNELVYWKDDTRTVTTTEVTAFPVMRYVYNGPDGVGVVKLKIFHEIDPVTGFAVPKMEWGQGTGVGDRGKGFVYKNRDGYMMKYLSAIDGAERSIHLNDDGIEIVPGLNGQGATLQVGLDANKPPISGLNVEETIASVSAFDNASGLGYSFTEQALVACNTNTLKLQYITRGGEFVREVTLANGIGVSLNGLEIDGDNEDYVWLTNNSRIYKCNNKTGEDLSPTTFLYSGANGIAAPPGDYIWFGVGGGLAKALKSTGVLIQQYEIPFPVSGVAYDGLGHLWLVGESSTAALFDIAAGLVTYLGSLPASQYTGATFDGFNLWVIDYVADTAVRLKTVSRVNSFYFATDTGKLYVSSSDRWVDVSGGGSSTIELGETSTTAYQGDRGKTAYDHSQSVHAPSNAQKNSDITKGEIESKLVGFIMTHFHSSGGSLAFVCMDVSGAISPGSTGSIIVSKASEDTTLYLPTGSNGLNYIIKNGGSGNITLQTPSGEGGSDAYTKVLLHLDGSQDSTSLVDLSGKAWTAYSGARITTTNKVFGTGSLLLPEGVAYISTPSHSDFSFGSDDFTIDFRLLLEVAQATYDTIFSLYTDATNRFSLMVSGANLVFHVINGGVTVAFYTTLHDVIALNSWMHVALVRRGADIFIFVNGVLCALNVTNAVGSQSMPNCTNPATIGARLIGSTPDRVLKGMIDEFRVSKGVARWTANFLAPQGAYTEGTNPPKIENDLDSIVIAPLESRQIAFYDAHWWLV